MIDERVLELTCFAPSVNVKTTDKFIVGCNFLKANSDPMILSQESEQSFDASIIRCQVFGNKITTD